MSSVAQVDRKLYRNSAIYTLCNFMLKAMNFLLLPLYTAFLTTADYGVTGLMDRFVAVASVLSTLSLQAGVMRFYVDYRDDSDMLPRFTGTVMCFALVSTFVFDLAFLALRQLLVPVLFEGVAFWPTVAVTLAGLAFTNVYSVYQQILRGMERARESAATSVAYLLLNIILSVALVIGRDMGALGVVFATALTGIIMSTYAVVTMVRAGVFVPCIDWGILRPMLHYTIPLMPHNLSTQIAALVSGVLINSGGSLGSVGLYNVASKFGNACDTLQSSVSTAYSPWLYRMLEDRPKGWDRQVVSFTSTILDVYVLVFVGVSYFVREPILLLLDASYAESWMLVAPIALVYAVKSAYYFYVSVLFYYKDAANKIFIATLTSSLLNVVISFPMVAAWASYGSILADGISMFVRVAIVIWLSRKYEDAGYRLRLFVSSFLVVLVAVVAGLLPCYIRPFDVSGVLLGWRVLLYAALIVWVVARHRKNDGKGFEPLATLRKIRG